MGRHPATCPCPSSTFCCSCLWIICIHGTRSLILSNSASPLITESGEICWQEICRMPIWCLWTAVLIIGFLLKKINSPSPERPQHNPRVMLLSTGNQKKNSHKGSQWHKGFTKNKKTLQYHRCSSIPVCSRCWKNCYASGQAHHRDINP